MKTTDDIKKIRKNKLREAAAGRKLFASMSKKHLWSKEKTAYVVFPTDDAEINFYGVLYLNDFALFHKYDTLVLLVCDEALKNTALHSCKKVTAAHVVSKEAVRSLIMYYALYEFSTDIWFVSVDVPEGRRGSNILGKKGLTKEQFVAIGIFKILPFRSADVKFSAGVNFTKTNGVKMGGLNDA